MHWYDALALLGVVFGLVGILIPLLPGSLLISIALVFWAFATATTSAWTGVALALALLGIGLLAKYLIPGRRLQLSGVPNRSIAIGAVAGVVGFFVIPLLGLPIGFVLGIYLAELERLGSQRAAASTWSALKAIGLAVVIEFTAGLLATVVFLGTWIAQ